jgi:hypothetical protein
MPRKTRNPNFEQLLEALRAHGFEVSPLAGVAEQVLVSKNGAAAVLTPGRQEAAAFVERPGALLGGEVACLLDRGYQKFLKTPHLEIPATASLLQAIHAFAEELKLLAGSISLYNEGLGSTSDLYQYDRVQGREAPQPAPRRPWEMTAGH